MTTFGQVDWAQEQTSSKKNSNKDLWLHLEQGDNFLRLVTMPYQYSSHKLKKDDGDKIGKKVYCSKAHGECAVCELVTAGDPRAEKSKDRWLVGVISRKDSKFKILDISWSIFNDIKKLNGMTQYWGDPTKYDLNIVVDKDSATSYYTVQPLPKIPLSIEDQAIIDDEVDLEDMQRRVTPPEPAKVKERVEKIFSGEDGKPAAKTPAAKTPAKSQTKAAPAQTAAPTASKVDMSADEGDDAFPDFDNQEA